MRVPNWRHWQTWLIATLAIAIASVGWLTDGVAETGASERVADAVGGILLIAAIGCLTAAGIAAIVPRR